jgi:hypothetical protein
MAPYFLAYGDVAILKRVECDSGPSVKRVTGVVDVHFKSGRWLLRDLSGNLPQPELI